MPSRATSASMGLTGPPAAACTRLGAPWSRVPSDVARNRGCDRPATTCRTVAPGRAGAVEESGRCRRGYVVEGLGAAQFAIPGAIDRLRAAGQPVDGHPATVVLAATDPAQPYGAALPWPPTVGDVRHLPGRKAGALAVLVDGAAVLYIERGGRSLLSFTED